MVNDLKIKRDTLLRKFNRNAIAKNIINMLPGNEVMFIYFAGSISYNTFNVDVSDVDIAVFVKEPISYAHVNVGDYDVFVYGGDVLLSRQELTNALPDYNRLFIDDKCSLDSTLIYLNPKFQKEYDEFKNFDLSKVFKDYLQNVYNYFMFLYVDSTCLSKKFYHVIRIRGQLENYKQTGVYDLTLPEEYRKEMVEFKQNFANYKTREYYLKKVGQYLEEIKAFEEGLT